MLNKKKSVPTHGRDALGEVELDFSFFVLVADELLQALRPLFGRRPRLAGPNPVVRGFELRPLQIAESVHRIPVVDSASDFRKAEQHRQQIRRHLAFAQRMMQTVQQHV